MAGVHVKHLDIIDVEPLRAEIVSFLESARDGAPPAVSGFEGRNALSLALRTLERIREHAEHPGVSELSHGSLRIDNAASRMNNFRALLQEHIDAGEFPSAVYLVAERDEIVYEMRSVIPSSSLIASQTRSTRSTISLHSQNHWSPALLCARRIELGELTLDSSVSHYLAGV